MIRPLFDQAQGSIPLREFSTLLEARIGHVAYAALAGDNHHSSDDLPRLSSVSAELAETFDQATIVLNLVGDN